MPPVRSSAHQAQSVVEQKRFDVSTASGVNIVNWVSLSGISGTDTTSLTVTTVPEGQSFEVLGKAYDVSINEVLLDR